MALTATFTNLLTIAWGVFANYDAGLSKAITTKLTLTNGTGANQVNKGYHKVHTLAASGTEDIDLLTIVNGYAEALALDEVVILRIAADPANIGNIEMKGGASNGWTSFLKDISDVIQIKPGSAIQLESLPASAYAVGGTNKVITFTNADGSNAGSYTLTILGRDT